MRAAVRASFVAYSIPLEGCVPWLYADVLGLITTGIGNLVDPISAALSLPLVHPGNGRRATRAEITAEWMRVKDDPRSAKLGHRYTERITTLRLTEDGVSQLVHAKLDANDVALARRYPQWESYPADAQLALHSLAWAVGPGYRFPRLDAALARRDFTAAAPESRIDSTGNAGVIPRSARQLMLLRNAGFVESIRLSPEVLWWPLDLAAEPVDRNADTVPELVPSIAPHDGARTVNDFDLVRAKVRLGRPRLDGDDDPEAT